MLAPLRLRYLRWVLFDVGSRLHVQYQGIFDTDFDKYTGDAVMLFTQTDIDTVFTILEGFPEDWKLAHSGMLPRLLRADDDWSTIRRPNGKGNCMTILLATIMCWDVLWGVAG